MFKLEILKDVMSDEKEVSRDFQTKQEVEDFLNENYTVDDGLDADRVSINNYTFLGWDEFDDWMDGLLNL
jgi:hypothetical protein